VRTAEAWLLRSLIKQNEGFMSRHFERRISLAITRRLATTSATPNAMTLVSVAVGLVAAPFFLSSSALWQLTGALLVLAHSFLDAVAVGTPAFFLVVLWNERRRDRVR